MGSNPCRKLSLLGNAHPIEGSLFQVQRAIGKTTLIRGHFLEESRLVALMDYLCKTCIKLVILIYVCIKSDVSTLELLYIVGVF